MAKRDQMRVEVSDASCAGASLLERMRNELDATMERMMAPEDLDEYFAEDLLRDRAYAQGVAWCIAVVQDPYHLTRALITVREEAMERYYNAHPERLPSEPEMEEA